jgi:hypothetical protein
VYLEKAHKYARDVSYKESIHELIVLRKCSI